MCLWILTACLGLLPSQPVPVIVVPAVPAPILQPTTAATTAATVTPKPMPPGDMTVPPGNMTMPPGNMTMPPGNMTMPPGNMTMPPGNMTGMMPGSPPGNSTPPASTAAPTTAAPLPSTVPPTAAPPSTAPPSTAPPTTALPITVAPTTAGPTTPRSTPAPTTIAPATTGSLAIDPRLGTTPASSAAYQSPITGYSAQIPSYDTAVRFPRQKRNIQTRKLLNVKDFIMQRLQSEHRIQKRASCKCVPAGTCANTSTSNSGAAMIDARIVTPVGQCPAGQEYCCGDTLIACGKLQTVPTTGVTPTDGQANYGEFPWQAIILTTQNDYIAGGVLIDKLNVLTVTHRLVSYVVSGTAPNLKVRLGEWDAAGTYEPIPFQEYSVQKVFTHPKYNPNTLQFDITVLRLSTPVPFTPSTGAVMTINRACLPPSATTTYNAQMCVVAGWGKNLFGVQGQYQQILKRVEVPIVAPGTCQTQLQTARLGTGYTLDTTSFVCAGGEANKDSCTGDGGSGLVCPVNGSWVVVGLVSWGLGCASANVSAAYVNIAGLLPWIQEQVATS